MFAWAASGLAPARQRTWAMSASTANSLEVAPPRKLAYTWSSSWMPAVTEVRWELEAQDNGTIAKLKHTGFGGNADQAKAHSLGWSQVLGWLQAFVETGETVDSRK